MNNKYKQIKLLLVLPLFLSLNSFTNSDSIEVGQVWKLNVRSSASMNGSGEVLFQIASDAYHTHRAREFNDWDVFSVVDSRDLVRIKKGYEIEVTEKLYSNEVLKVKLLDGKYKGKFYYAIADDLAKKYLLEEKNVEGGETAMLHLDDWEHCHDLSNDPVGKQDFIWGSPKSKNVDYKVEHPVFSSDEKGRPQISYIDQFPEPKNMDQGNFLQRLSDALEESKNKVITKLPVGCSIIANNYFWLHGRKPFKENKELSRELLRIRGSFFVN